MLRGRLASFFKSSNSAAKPVGDGKSVSFARKAVSFVLITVTGGVALSALDDLAIYYSCTRKAMEKASSSEAIKNAIGEPITKGPWYNASLAVAHKRHSVSCTFPVSGPHGSGVLQMKAIRNGANEGKEQTMQISVSNNSPLACKACVELQPQKSKNPEKN